MNIIHSIVSPTILQAKRESDGTLTAIVSTDRHAPHYGYITAADYTAHEMAGLIQIHVLDPHENGFTEVNYTVL